MKPENTKSSLRTNADKAKELRCKNLIVVLEKKGTDPLSSVFKKK